MIYFADTSFFLSRLIRSDPMHARASNLASGPGDQMLTTEWILLELADGLCNLRNRDHFVALYHRLRTAPNVEIVEITRDLWLEGFQLYRSRMDKEWSLTDCMSFCVMSARNLTQALTADHHFEQAGFVALLK